MPGAVQPDGEAAELSAVVRRPGRLVGLDGIRGLAALFVVLHHCWLQSFPGFPRDTGPFWLGWLLYGHLAVVVFIVLSGFSLAVAPARRDWQLGGIGRFLRRRAWRILPPYWAALVFSVLISALVVTDQPSPPTGKSVAVFGLLLQDAVPAPSPNSAFWSIAVEAQLYLVFPLLLVLRRRWGALPLVALVATVVAGIQLLSGHVGVFASLLHLTPEFAVLFTLGAVTAGVLRPDPPGWLRRVPWPLLAGAGAVLAVVGIGLAGSVWTVDHYFWVDQLVGVPVACLLAAVASGRPGWLVRALDSRPLAGLGAFSYSLYLVHVPIVVLVNRLLVAPHLPHGTPVFLVTLLVAAPVAVGFARVFGSVFELPFVRHRSARALLSAVRAGRPAPVEPVAESG